MTDYVQDSIWKLTDTLGKRPELDEVTFRLNFFVDGDDCPSAELVDNGVAWDWLPVDQLGKISAQDFALLVGSRYTATLVSKPEMCLADRNGQPCRAEEHPCRVLFDANPHHHCDLCKRSLMLPKVEEPEDIIVKIDDHPFEEPIVRQGWDNFSNFSQGQMIHGYVHIATGSQMLRAIGSRWCWSTTSYNPKTGKRQVFFIDNGQTVEEFMADLEVWMEENPWVSNA